MFCMAKPMAAVRVPKNLDSRRGRDVVRDAQLAEAHEVTRLQEAVARLVDRGPRAVELHEGRLAGGRVAVAAQAFELRQTVGSRRRFDAHQLRLAEVVREVVDVEVLLGVDERRHAEVLEQREGIAPRQLERRQRVAHDFERVGHRHDLGRRR
jgi:hypothetical protein